MKCLPISLILTAACCLLAGCTGESVRIVLPDDHPASPAAAEAPFVLPADPFAAEIPSPPPADRPLGHLHGNGHGAAADDMEMDDMEMDDDGEAAAMPGDHGGHGAAEKGGEP